LKEKLKENENNKNEYLKIEMELKNVKEELKNTDNDCIICEYEKINTCIVPCGHLIICFKCYELWKKKLIDCPLCQNKISQVIKTYNK
jgi:hypothetical protein